LKTAVLIACSLKLGALMAGAKQSDADLLYEYGINLGLAFQLQDDWLDVYGDPQVFGKKKGGDICANKKTCLLLKAAENCDPSTLQQLESWISKSDFDPEQKIAAITAIYDKTGVNGYVRGLMQNYYNKSLASLRSMDIPEGKKITLAALAEEVITRIK
jgi:geranylgeranyl diphosphate synthase type II